MDAEPDGSLVGRGARGAGRWRRGRRRCIPVRGPRLGHETAGHIPGLTDALCALQGDRGQQGPVGQRLIRVFGHHSPHTATLVLFNPARGRPTALKNRLQATLVSRMHTSLKCGASSGGRRRWGRGRDGAMPASAAQVSQGHRFRLSPPARVLPACHPPDPGCRGRRSTSGVYWRSCTVPPRGAARVRPAIRPMPEAERCPW